MRLPRREEASEVVDHLLHNIGVRRATSLAEAEAAAYLDGRLRRAGLGVSIEIFRTARHGGYVYLLLGLLALLAAILARWMVLPSFLLASWGLALTLSDLLLAPLPVLAPRRESQNVHGSRACEKTTRWRLVLLAPLDTALRCDGIYSLSGRHRNALIARCLAAGLLTLFALLNMLDPALPIWRYLAFAPAIYLLLSGLPLQPLTPSHSASASGRAAALAVLPRVAEQCRHLRQVEVWFLALGATATGPAGLHDLLQRYPFPKAETLWIGIEQIDQGQLTFTTREGLLREYPADTLLTRLIADVDAADDTIDIEPRAYNHTASLVTPLLRRGYRAVTLVSRPTFANLPANSSNSAGIDTPDMIDRTTRLLLGIIRRLDESRS